MDLPVVILAGGAGTRLGGECKALIRHEDGSTLIARLCAELGPWVYVSTTERWSRAIRSVVCAPQILDEGRGPARALQAAAERLEAEWIALVAVDQLGVTRRTIAALAAARGSGTDAVFAAPDRPLPGLYRAPALRALPPLEDRSLKGLAAVIRVRCDAAIDGPSADLNTPKDLARERLRLA